MENKKKQLQKVPDILELSEMLKAIAHPARVAIMYLLCNSSEKRLTVKCIYNELKMAQPVISRHLGILKNSGLIEREVENSKIYYRLQEKNKNVRHISRCFSTLN